jgi:hypothetical protein
MWFTDTEQLGWAQKAKMSLPKTRPSPPPSKSVLATEKVGS